MIKWRKTSERGSIEVIILVLVFAVAVGLVAWRVAETQNAQSDAESSAAVANNAPDTAANYVAVSELHFSFLNPQNAGTITYKVSGEKTIRLTSGKLAKSAYSCDGESTGEFGAITVAQKDEPKPIPAPKLTKIIGDKEYRFSSGLQTMCYDETLTAQFSEAVPSAIMNSIKETT